MGGKKHTAACYHIRVKMTMRDTLGEHHGSTTVVWFLCSYDNPVLENSYQQTNFPTH